MALFSSSTLKVRSPLDDPVNIASPEFKANPFPFYARLRAEAPVFRVTLPIKEAAWLITRYDDVAMVLRDERFAKEPANAMTPEQIARQRWIRKVFKSLNRNMLNLDPPDHSRLRALVHNGAMLPQGPGSARHQLPR